MKCLKEFRLANNFSVPEISKKIDVSVSFYTKIERGERGISREFMRRFKKAFPLFDMNIFFDELLHRKCGKRK